MSADSAESPGACRMCPSAQSDMAEAILLGVHGGSPKHPHIRYLETPESVNSQATLGV